MERKVMIRRLQTKDIESIKHVIDSTGLFPSELFLDMVSSYFDGNPKDEIWLAAEDEKACGVLFCKAEELTEGTRNCLLVAVHSSRQGQGLGTAMMNHLESILRERGDRILLVETSSLAEFENTRRFYEKLGYAKEATVRDFYAQGENKIIYRKSL